MAFNELIGHISEWLGVIAVAWLLSIAPRFQKPPVGFRYARRDGILALMLYGLILVFAFLYYSLNPPIFTEPLRLSPAPIHDLGQALLAAGVSLMAFLVALAMRRQPARAAGWHQALLRPGLLLGVALAILTIFLRNRVMDVLGGLGAPVLGMLPLALGVTLAEETIFRGYIQLRLVWWLGVWPGIILTAALFALWHLPPWLRALPVETTLILLALTFVQGLVLGWLMRKSGHVVGPALYRAISIWVTLIG